MRDELGVLLATAGSVAGMLVGPGAPVAASRHARAGMTATVEQQTTRFLAAEQTRAIRASFGSPAYVYDEATLREQAGRALEFPNAYGLTVRFAMKALPNAAVLQLFDRMGLHVDASSGYEVRRAIAAGVDASRISLSSQELAPDLDELLALGIKFNACSLRQLEAFGKLRPGASDEQLGVRFNPGLGSGGTGKTNVGGPASSFGIWHELMPEVQAILAKHDLKPWRVHTHIGSGSDPAVWTRVADLSLGLVKQVGASEPAKPNHTESSRALAQSSPRPDRPLRPGALPNTPPHALPNTPRLLPPSRQLPSVRVLNLGGGYKVGRMPGEVSTELGVVGEPVKLAFEKFATSDGRQLHLEVEPGTFLVANAGALLASVQARLVTV